MLSVLIVNWNTREYLRDCLRSLLDTCTLPDYEIIVVDNASSDGSAAMVRAEFPSVQLVANDNNAGYARANNQAYALARGETVWLLNPDTRVRPGAPAALLEFLLAEASRGAVASRLVDVGSGRTQLSCRTFPTPAALWTEALGLARAYPRSRRFGFYRMGWWRYDSTRQVEQPMASSLMLRRQAVEQAGRLFDEQFPIFFNDVDLCWRLRHRGWKIWYLATAAVEHHLGASTSQVRRAMISESHRSLRRFYEQHYHGRINYPLYRATVALIEISRWCRERVSRRAC